MTPRGPPVFLGGAGGPRMIRHVVDYADGWFPNHSGPDVDAALERLRREAEDRGRDPATIRLSIPGPVDAVWIDEQHQRGFERVLLSLPSAPADVVLPILDKHAALAASLNQS